MMSLAIGDKNPIEISKKGFYQKWSLTLIKHIILVLDIENQ